MHYACISIRQPTIGTLASALVTGVVPPLKLDLQISKLILVLSLMNFSTSSTVLLLDVNSLRISPLSVDPHSVAG